MTGLHDSIRIGTLLLPNRLVMAPLTRCRAGEEGIPNALMAEYYRQRSGAGLIIAEGTNISPQAKGYPGTPGIWNTEQVNAWKMVTDAVHSAGGRIFVQLWHTGRLSHPDLLPPGMHPVAPSAIAGEGAVRATGNRHPFPVPKAMLTEEVEATVQDYIRAGSMALQAGFDGVELHAANGYLPEQFLNDGTNQRTDKYGGAATNRYRFILEILEGLLDIWGEDRVGIRLSPSGVRFGTFDSDPVQTYSGLVRKLNELPLAYLHLVEPLTEIPETYLAQVLPHFRKIYQGRIITAGGYDATMAAEVIHQGEAEMVAFGRLFISNPDLPERIRIGEYLNEPDQRTFYTSDEKGYTDYPFFENNS